MELELNDTEQRELSTLLTTTLGELSMEIADTDNPTYRRALQERRDVLAAIAAALGT